MKYRTFFVIAVLLNLVGRTKADNLAMDPVSMKLGETRQVGIILQNPHDQYVAFQFEIVLPDGITIVNNEAGKPDISLNQARANGHTMTVLKKGANTYGLLAYSFPVSTFSGVDGALVFLTLKAENKTSDDALPLKINSQVFTLESGDEYKWADLSIPITIESYSGDANGDGKVDQEDACTISDHIMYGEDSNFYFQNADINNDKEIDVADIVLVVNLFK